MAFVPHFFIFFIFFYQKDKQETLGILSMFNIKQFDAILDPFSPFKKSTT